MFSETVLYRAAVRRQSFAAIIRLGIDNRLCRQNPRFDCWTNSLTAVRTRQSGSVADQHDSVIHQLAFGVPKQQVSMTAHRTRGQIRNSYAVPIIIPEL